jgi:hypothetical protein
MSAIAISAALVAVVWVWKLHRHRSIGMELPRVEARTRVASTTPARGDVSPPALDVLEEPSTPRRPASALR